MLKKRGKQAGGTAIIINGTAGKHAGKASALQMAARIMAEPHLVFTTNSRGELESAARDIASRPDIKVLGVFGGDSTASSSLKSVISKRDPDHPNPLIFHLAGGTMNTVARSAGMVKDGDKPEDIVRLAKRVKEKLDAGIPPDVVHLSPLCINQDYGFLFGAGTPMSFLEEYNQGSVRGKGRAFKVICDTLKSELLALMTLRKKAKHSFFSEVHARIVLPEGHEPPVAPYMTHTAIMCGTVEQIGLGCHGLPEARAKVGHFMLRSTSLSFWGVMMNAPLLFMGRPVPFMFDAVVPRLKISFEGATNIMIDGDIKPADAEYDISLGPTLKFITG